MLRMSTGWRWTSLAVAVAGSLAACDQLFAIDEGQPAGADGGADSSLVEASSDGGRTDASTEASAEASADAPPAEGGATDAGCGATCATDISANGAHTCAVMGDQSVVCWGGNANGECGPNAHGGPMPVTVPGFGPARVVKTSDTASCALLVDKSVWCWGSNARNTLGVPDSGTGDAGIAPVQTLPPGTASDLLMGAYHACASTAATPSQVLCWGENASGQSGVVDASTVPSPTALAITNVIQMAAAAFNTCFLRSTAPTTECIGENTFGELGLGGDGGPDSGIDNLAHAIPTPVVDVASFGTPKLLHHSCGYHMAVTYFSAALAMWGDNNDGQLGPQDDSGAPNPNPALVTALNEVTQVSMTQYSTCVLRVDGSVWCWGSTDDGQTGSTTNGGPVQVQPSQVMGIADGGATALVAGLTHVCAIVAGGGIECWGYNGSGELGRKTTAAFDPAPAPVQF
jgi:alpha-tubulin suppressor-like RCC1 family protein